MNKILTMMDIKKARDGIAAAFSVDTLTAARLIGFYNGAGDVETVAALVAGDYSSIPSAAAALGVSLQGVKAPETVGGSAGDDRPGATDDRSTKKTAGSIKKEKAHNGDILTDTAHNNKRDNIPTSDKKKGKQAQKAAYDSITAGALTTMDIASRPESATITADTIKGDIYKSVDTIPRVDSDIIPANISSDILPASLPDNIESWLSDFSTRYNIELIKASGQQWRSACIYIGQHIQQSKILEDIQREKQQGGKIYNPDAVAALLPIWEYITGLYKHIPLVCDFIAFSGVSRNWFHDYDGRGLTSARVHIVKKARDIEEAGLSVGLVDGRENPTGRIYYSKARLGWQEQTTVVHVSAAAAPVAPSLPVFDGAGGLLVDNSAGGVDN